MRQKDIAIIAAVVLFGGIIAIFASKLLIRDSDKKQKAEVVQAITSDFPSPDKRFFNPNALNPTQTIQIGDNANPDPFKGAPGQ